MTTYDAEIDKLHLVHAIDSVGRSNALEPDIIDYMVEALRSEAGLVLYPFCQRHNLRYNSILRPFNRMAAQGDVIEVIHRARPVTFKFKRKATTFQAQQYMDQLARLSELEAFRAAFNYKENDHSILMKQILTSRDEELPERIIRAATFAVTVAHNLNVYINQHKDSPLANQLEKLLKEDRDQATPKLLEFSHLWFNHQNRD